MNDNLIGKKVRLFVTSPNGELTYTCKINKIDKYFIHFTDKFNDRYSFRKTDIRQITEFKDEGLQGEKDEN